MIGRLKQFFPQVFRDFSKDECPSMAAALAYAAIFSLPSVLLIVIYCGRACPRPQGRERTNRIEVERCDGPAGGSANSDDGEQRG